MYGQLEVNHDPGSRECTAVAVEYYTLLDGSGDVVLDVVVRPFEWQVVIQPWTRQILKNTRYPVSYPGAKYLLG